MRRIRKYYSQHQSGSIFVALVLVCLILMSLTSNAFVMSPKRAATDVVSLFQRAAAGIEDFVSRFFSAVGELRQLRAKYLDLQEELITYRRDERELIELRRENEELRSLLQLSDTVRYEHQVARVIASDPSSFFNTVVIDRGSIHGVESDLPVVANQDGFRGLVGRVTWVGPFSAQVLPVFDANSYVNARLQNQRFNGLVQGGGDRFVPLSMSYVPKSARESISLGDLVATSGRSSIFPPDIYVGRVRGISAKSWEASLTLELSPMIDFSRLEYVFILAPESVEAE